MSALMAGMGLLTARFAGFQFGIISLSIGAVFTGVVVGYPNIFGGGLGLSGFALIIPANASYRQQLILGIVVWAVCALSVWLVSESRLGPRVIAVGDDPFLAIASGLNPVRIRVQALAISGALAGRTRTSRCTHEVGNQDVASRSAMPSPHVRSTWRDASTALDMTSASR